MAIVEMSKMTVVGLHSDCTAILEELHKTELFEVCEMKKEGMGLRETEKSLVQFGRHMQSAEAALSVLEQYAPENQGLFSRRRTLPMEKYHMNPAECDAVLAAVYRILDLAEKIRGHTETLDQISAKQAELEPYALMDIPVNTQATDTTLAKFGVLNGRWPAERLQKELNDIGLPTVHFEVASMAKERTHLWLVFPKNQESEVASFLREISFVETNVFISGEYPLDKTEAFDETKVLLVQEKEAFISEMKSYVAQRREIELVYDQMSLLKDKQEVQSKLGKTEYTFILEGYTPKSHGEQMKQLLECKYAAYVELAAPEHTEDVPILFQNNAIVAPVEGITEAYSIPSSADIDPNSITAFFYYLLFGMMFSDAGYGLLLTFVCGYLGFSKQLEQHKQGTYRMFFYCGISTTIWGFLFGSFFGNIVHVVSVSFIGHEVTLAPLWLDPITNAMNLLVFSIGLGMIQILVGLGIKFFVLCRQGEIWDAILDIGLWMLSLSGFCVLAAGMGLHDHNLVESGKWIAATGALGLLVTGGRKSNSVLGRVFGGLIGLYSITGYVSDALSYCRLMALGIATGAIANVVNMLGTMFGDSVVGGVLFTLVGLLGHSLNFAMNLLGAYVHTNRLQYVEFFSKFYEGGGKKFDPFQMNTKYYRFSDEVGRSIV